MPNVHGSTFLPSLAKMMATCLFYGVVPSAMLWRQGHLVVKVVMDMRMARILTPEGFAGTHLESTLTNIIIIFIRM